MNEFQNNNNDNMTDNYKSSFGQDNSGEYSYSYTPKDRKDREEKPNKPRAWMVAVILVSVFALTFSTIMCALALGTFFECYSDDDVVENGNSDHEGGTPGINVSVGGNSTPVSIPKLSKQDIESQPEDDGLTSAGQPYSDITKVYNAVSDSVVEITTEIVQNSIWMGQYVTTGAGSGVIVHADGYIVTNHHVIEGASNITVRLKDGNTFTASFVGTDASSDIAVIKIEAEDLKVADLGCSDELVVGEAVIAIGNPLGSLGGTVTEGIISATERHITINGSDMALLQTSAAINPGNSGGGLFNMAGHLVGVVNAKAAGDDIEGLGFAIPIDTAYGIILDLINYGYVRGVVDHGISTIDVTTQNLYYYRQYGITETGAIVIESEYSDKLIFGDRIVTVNGEDITCTDDIVDALEGAAVGQTVEITLLRDGELMQIEILLYEEIPDYIDFGD